MEVARGRAAISIEFQRHPINEDEVRPDVGAVILKPDPTLLLLILTRFILPVKSAAAASWATPEAASNPALPKLSATPRVRVMA